MGNPGTKQIRLQQSSVAGSQQARESSLQSFLLTFSSARQSGQCPEDAFRASVPLQHRKRFAQFFTPMPIAELMVGWIAGIKPKTVLDPAVGPGIFPRVVHAVLPDAEVTALDVDSHSLAAARLASAPDSRIRFLEQDFLTWDGPSEFDAAIANPPYLRHHDFSYPPNVAASISARSGIRFSRLSNLYVFFIVEICRRLKRGGRAAILVPGEWVNANFGAALKAFLLSNDYLRQLVYFSHAASQFEDALTTASILFLEKPKARKPLSPIRTVFVSEGAEFSAIPRLLNGEHINTHGIVTHDFLRQELLAHKKWNHLLAHASAASPAGFVTLSTLAESRRGIATGANSFFHVKPSTVREYRLPRRSLLLCIGKAKDVSALIFSRTDLKRIADRDGRSYLVSTSTPPSPPESAYLRKGETDLVHERYLCRAHRPHWFSMEKRAPSPIWVTVFARRRFRFILNSAAAHNLTTFHCLYPKFRGPLFAEALTACLNSRVVQDLAKRHLRAYGGGLLKVEPKDVLEMEVPDLRHASMHTMKALSRCLKNLDAAIRASRGVSQMEAALDRAVNEAAKEIRQRSSKNSALTTRRTSRHSVSQRAAALARTPKRSHK